MNSKKVISASFRDPNGFLYSSDGLIFRQINKIYAEHYDHLIHSGLYNVLVDARLLIPHEEVALSHAMTRDAYKVIKPDFLAFISYPYEWCFSQLKDAALTTLAVQKRALEYGMTLKDGSSYNIQFHKGMPVLIDSLSFEKYREGEPWVAYRQFCQHFLAPLALMAYKDVRLGQLLRVYIDGLPLAMASSLLPCRAWLRFSLLTHVYLHARSQTYFGQTTVPTGKYKMSRRSFCGLIENLDAAIKRLQWHNTKTEWSNYYVDTNYSMAALQHKQRVVSEFLSRVNPRTVWDLGANVGLFSQIPAGMGIHTISFDNDYGSVERNYAECVRTGQGRILPLVLDLTNPSPNIGWEQQERLSLFERGPADTVLALALIHHLCISNNVPLRRAAEFFTKVCHSLIIEFIPKVDSQVQRLLASRQDIFTDHTQTMFEKEFTRFFEIEDSTRLVDSERTLYLMRRKSS
ncbi:MAG: SAM-dependent methyltransferase [Candidatus Binatia bacterium]